MTQMDVLNFQYRTIPAVDRFWNHVVKKSTNDCWAWKGCKNHAGYGMLTACGKTWIASRLSWIINRGDIENGMCVLHHCDNPECVNPDHLFVGTKRDNNIDKMKKHREVVLRGEQHGMSKLTMDQVLAIRTCYAKSDITHLQLGWMYGITDAAVKAIIDGKTWKHVGGPIGTKKDIYRNQRGVNARDAKLTANQVREIRRLSESGIKGCEIANEFGVSRSCVYGVIHRTYYGTVSD